MTCMHKTMAAALLGALVSAPGVASAERIITRSGEVLYGDPRFEGQTLVVRRADGSEVRIPRSQVERIELDNGEPAPRPPPRRAPPPPRAAPAPRPPPSYPRYVPPPPPPPPDPAVGRRMLQNTGFQSGLALDFGWQRGLAFGLEWQQRIDRYVGLGIGGQLGLATNEDVACPTFGGTGRLYLGMQHRFVTEAGFGLNRIDPYLDLRGPEEPTCGDAEKNFGPELSLGYQYASRTGFLFEILGGATVLTNDDLADAHDDVAPIFQVGFGFVFR
ncbi:hypothetical protein [Vulgatibacter sp.]|uniref:hypothetical protein n=1 Tax=Vulgatibacter sp. TaxID=1971226 RepID=UPI003568AAA0